MAHSPSLPYEAALAVANQCARALRVGEVSKSFGKAGDALGLELDVSLPIRALAPSPSARWDPAIDVSAQASHTSYWHHQLRFLDALDRYAISRFTAGTATRPIVTAISQRSTLARDIDSAITIIDRDVPDDAYVASVLKIPSHAVLAILLSLDEGESELFVVAAPASFDRVQAGKRYRASGDFLHDLNLERAGGGYRLS